MTRTYSNLYPKIIDLENLWDAWRRARRYPYVLQCDVVQFFPAVAVHPEV